MYKQERIEVSVGDVIRVRHNDREFSLVNGDRLRVERLEKSHIIFTGGKRQVKLSTDKLLHLDHAYASTVHSSQGLTDDLTLNDINTKSSTTARDVYYVAISRARKEARIYTNSIEALPGAISR